MHTADELEALFRDRFDATEDASPIIRAIVEAASEYAAEMVMAERERCCGIVFGQASSDNVAQRTVDAIRGVRSMPKFVGSHDIQDGD